MELRLFMQTISLPELRIKEMNIRDALYKRLESGETFDEREDIDNFCAQSKLAEHYRVLIESTESLYASKKWDAFLSAGMPVAID